MCCTSWISRAYTFQCPLHFVCSIRPSRESKKNLLKKSSEDIFISIACCFHLRIKLIGKSGCIHDFPKAQVYSFRRGTHPFIFTSKIIKAYSQFKTYTWSILGSVPSTKVQNSEQHCKLLPTITLQVCLSLYMETIKQNSSVSKAYSILNLQEALTKEERFSFKIPIQELGWDHPFYIRD